MFHFFIEIFTGILVLISRHPSFALVVFLVAFYVLVFVTDTVGTKNRYIRIENIL